MFSWFREMAEQADAERKQHEQESKARAEARNAERKERMLSRPCAINGMQNCQAVCVHFREGAVVALADLDGGSIYVNDLPKCRLWRED